MSVDIPENIRRAGAGAVAHYAKLRSAGQSHKWAEMCALQQPPGTRGTDRAYMEGRYNQQWLDEMPRDQANKLVSEAKAAGINISGKFYHGGIADKRGHLDPAAWVEGTDDVRRVAKERNLTVTGAVEHKGHAVDPPKPKRLSARLTREMMAHERRINPGRKISDGDLKELVKNKYGRKHKR